MTAGIEEAVLSLTNGDTSPDESLQASLLDAVCDGLSTAVIVYDKNDLVLFASRQVLNFFPMPPSFLLPATRLRDFLGAVFDTGVHQNDEQAKMAGAVPREDWISQKIASHWRERFDGNERYGPDRWLRFVKRRLPTGFGICLIFDISEEKKREDQWRIDLERVQLTEDILDNLPFPIFVKDRNMTYVAINKAFCEKYQTTPDIVLGRKGADLFSADVASRFEESDLHVIETGEMSVSRQRQIAPDGAERDIVTRKMRIGKPGRYFLVASTQDLPKDGLDVDEFALAADIKTSSDQSYKRAYVPVAILQEAARKPTPMETFVPDSFSGRKILVVTADRSVESAALKMLAKYGFESCSVRDETEQAAFLDIAGAHGIKIDLVVADSQLGKRCLELAERQNVPALLLDGFQMANELTFLIARHFNRGMRGKGDHPAAGRETWTTGPAIEIGNVQVLVAEDNEINQIVFSQILEGLGYRYKIAATGDEVVRMWAEHRPQIVLMDISLPGFDGIEAARMIRGMEEDSDTKTPIIGVLNQAFELDRSQCMAVGMNGVILKPLSPDMLETIFQKYMRDDQGEPERWAI